MFDIETFTQSSKCQTLQTFNMLKFSWVLGLRSGAPSEKFKYLRLPRKVLVGAILVPGGLTR